MERDEVVQLVQVIAAYDNRRIDELLIQTWSESARRARWTMAAATDAVHEHFARSTAWLMPGHVTEAIRTARRQPAPVDQVLELTGPPPASEERRAEVLALVRNLADRKAIGNA